MMHQSYYDYQLKPIILDTTSIGRVPPDQADKTTYHLAKMKVVSWDGTESTEWIEVSADQLEGILRILNTTI